MKSNVFNNSIGSPYSFYYPQFNKQQSDAILALLFEQLLIFDKVTINTGRLNFALTFLIQQLGLATVERLLESNYIEFLLWTPMIFTSSGKQLDDGSIDESTIYGQPPLMSGTLSPDDVDLEKNIGNALNNFNLKRNEKRGFIKKAAQSYIIPDGIEFSSESANLVIDAYKNNNLATLGLPFDKSPDMLNVAERSLLLNLGNQVIETALLSQYDLKSYETYEHTEIVKQNLSNIGKGYNISENTSTILKLENLPNLKQLYLTERINFDAVFKLRHLGNAKYYRKWINEVGENKDAQEITTEYINEIKGGKGFFEKTGGKFIRNMGVFGVGTALSLVLSAPAGITSSYVLGLLDTFLLDSLIHGRNASMFIDDIKKVAKN